MNANDIKMSLELIGRAPITGKEAIAVAQLMLRLNAELQPKAPEDIANGDSAQPAE